MNESDFRYFKSQRKAMFEEWGIVGGKSRRARDLDGRFSRFGEVGVLRGDIFFFWCTDALARRGIVCGYIGDEQHLFVLSSSYKRH